MVIRPVEPKDAEALQKLYLELTPEDPMVNLEDFKALLLEIISTNHLTIFVLETDGEVVSTCYFNFIPNLTRGLRPYALIEQVVTAKKYRGRGFGTTLLQRVVEIAKEKNCYKVMLLTSRQDPEIHAFYTKVGFDGDAKRGYQVRFD